MAQLTVDTGINTKPIIQGAKDMQKAIDTLVAAVEKTGESVDAITVGYQKAFINSQVATQNFREKIVDLENTVKALRSQLIQMAGVKIENPEYRKVVKDLADINKELGTLARRQSQLEGQDASDLEDRWDKATSIILKNQQKLSPLGSKEYAEYVAAQKEMAQMVANHEDEIVRAYKDTNSAIADAMNQRSELVRKQNEMKSRGKDTQYGIETAEYKNAETILSQLTNQISVVKANGEEALRPINTTKAVVQYVVNLLSRADTGLAGIASSALNAAVSLGKMVASGVVTVIKQLATLTWRAATGIANLAAKAFNAAANLAKMAGSAVISFLRRLAEAARNAAAQIAKVAGKAVVAGLKGIGSLASRAGKAILGIGKSAKRSNNSLGQAVKMLVRYGFGVRSIYMLVRRLRSALVDAFKNMAKQVPEVNKAISSLSASLGMLKNSMATAFQPILNAIAPILTQFMDMLSEAMTKVGMFFAALVGQDYVYKATKAQFDYAKSLKKTAKSAKEAENQLASFDELNILKAPNGSTSGADADANTADGGKFIKTPLNEGIKAFAQTLKKMLRNGQFATMGKLLASRINSFIKSIDFDGYARKVGKLINGAVDLYNAFMEGIEWGNIGKALGTGLNGLLDSINWSNLGRAFSQRINAIFGMLAGFIETANFADAGKALSDAVWGFFGSIKWEEIGTTIGQGLTKIVQALYVFAVTFPWAELGERIANGANNLFSEIDPIEVADALIAIIRGAFDSLASFIATFNWSQHGTELANGIRRFIKELPTKSIGGTLRGAIIKVLSFIKPALKDKETWRQAGVSLGDMLNELFGKDQDGKTIWDELAEEIPFLIGDVIAALTGAVGEFEWGEAGEQFRQAALKLIEKFPTEELTHLLTIAIKGIIDLFGPTLSDPKVWREAGIQLSNALNAFFGKESLWEEAGKTANGMLNGILTFGRSFLGGFRADDAARNIKAALRQIEWDSIATQTWGVIKLAFKKAGDFLNVLFGDDEVKTSTHRIPAGLKGAYAVTDDLSKTVSKHIETDNSSLGTKIGNKIREALSKIPWKSIGEELWNSAKAIGTNIEDFLVSILGITPNEVNDAGGKLKAIGSKIGSTVGRALSQIPWGTILSDAKDFLLTALGDMFNELADPNNGEGPVLLKIVGVITGLEIGIKAALAVLKAAIVGNISAMALDIKVAGLAVIDALLISYDYTKLKDASDAYAAAGEARDNLIKTYSGTYLNLLHEHNKETADAYAEAVAQIDTTNMEVDEAIQALTNKAKQDFGDAPTNMWDAFKSGWNDYFGKDGKGIAAFITDASHSVLDAFRIPHKDSKKQDTTQYGVGRFSTFENDGRDAANAKVNGYINQTDDRKPDIQKANEDTFTIELVDPAKQGAKDTANAVADTYVDQANARKKDVQEANDDTFTIELIDPAKESTKDVADAAADGYVDQINSRKQDIQKANDEFIPSSEETSKAVAELDNKLKSQLAIIEQNVKTYGGSVPDYFFNSFEAEVTTRNALHSPKITGDMVAYVDAIFGPGAAEAYNQGRMTPELFWQAWQDHSLVGQPEAVAAIDDAASNVFGSFSEAAELGAAGASDGLWSTFIDTTLANQGEAEEAVLSTFDYLWSAINAEGNGELIASDWMYSIIGELDALESENEDQFVAIVTRMFGSVDAYEEAKGNGKDFMYGLVNGMSGEEGDTKDKLVGIIDRVLGYVQHSPEGFDSNSPSKRAAGYGEDFMKGFVQGVGSEESDTKKSTVGVFDNIFGGIVASAAALALLNLAVSVSMNSMSDKMSTTLTTISSSFSTAWQTIGTTVTTAVSNIVSTVPRLFGEMGRSITDQGWWSVGDYIVAGIQSGVQDNWHWLSRTVWNLAISLYNTARNALGIHSPSRLFREGVGQMIGLGVAEGFEDTEPTIMNSVTEVADAMVDKMARTDMQFDVGTETALSSFSDKIADSFATLLDRLQAIADSVTFRTPAVAAGTVVPYNVAAKVGGDSTGLVEALEVSNDDLASVIIQATNNAAVAIVDAIQRHGGINNPNVSAQTNAIIDEINRRTRANGASPILM